MDINIAQKSKGFRYGSFTIADDHGAWNGDESVYIKLEESSDFAYREAIWNPLNHNLRTSYETALTGMCIWAKHDCFFHFKPKAKGNPGARRSLSNPKDREDILKRIEDNQQIEKIRISKDPFGPYQIYMMMWQEEVVSRFNIRKLYYSLPIEEYDAVIKSMEEHLPGHLSSKLKEVLYSHSNDLHECITTIIPTEIEFIYPMRNDPSLTIENSYTWPYRTLDIELGIEEMEEIRIPYQAMKEGARVPPILLGMLGAASPFYEQRHHHGQMDYIVVEENPSPKPPRSKKRVEAISDQIG
jgi:hypothetical protein